MAAKPGRFSDALLDEVEKSVREGATKKRLAESYGTVIIGGGRRWFDNLLSERSRAREAERTGLRAPALASVRTMVEGLRRVAETDPAAGDELAAALTFEAKLVQLSTRGSA
jgi:hypothetical protein